jgi:hypothetical protein
VAQSRKSRSHKDPNAIGQVVLPENDSYQYFVYQVIIAYVKHDATAADDSEPNKSNKLNALQTSEPLRLPQTQIQFGKKIPRLKIPRKQLPTGDIGPGHLKCIILVNSIKLFEFIKLNSFGPW